MRGRAIITEACIGVQEHACVAVCPAQCIYGFDPVANRLIARAAPGVDAPDRVRKVNAEAIAVYGSSLLYVHPDECTECGACYRPGVCPAGAIYSDDGLPDGSMMSARYNDADPYLGRDDRFFRTLVRAVFAPT